MPAPTADTELAGMVRDHATRIARRRTEAIMDSVQELGDLGLIEAPTVEIRSHAGTPWFKLYILNGEEVLFGFYPVVEHTVTISGKPTTIYDVMGKDATCLLAAIWVAEPSNLTDARSDRSATRCSSAFRFVLYATRTSTGRPTVRGAPSLPQRWPCRDRRANPAAAGPTRARAQTR